MKNAIQLFLIILLSFAAKAQAPTSAGDVSDPEAIRLLEQIKSNYDSHKSHLIEFDFIIELPGEAVQTQKGTLLQSGEKFELDIDSRKIISDNKTVWLYLKEDNEVQINDADFGDDGEYMSPNSIFKLYQSDAFVFAVFQHLYEEGKAVTQIECKPKDADSEYAKMRLTVVDKGPEVKRFKIFAKDGSRYTMVLKTHQTDVPLKPGAFSFNPAQYIGIIVEDLRF